MQPPMQIPALQPVMAPQGWAPQVYDQVELHAQAEKPVFTAADPNLDMKRGQVKAFKKGNGAASDESGGD